MKNNLFIWPKQPITERMVYSQELRNFWSEAPCPKDVSVNYSMFDIKNKRVLGRMIATPTNNDIYIDYLLVDKRRVGVGRDFIKLAEIESSKRGYNGHLSLLSTQLKLRNEKEAPHLFYRKQGFKTKSPLMNMIMDICIKLKKNLPQKLNGIKFMYK